MRKVSQLFRQCMNTGVNVFFPRLNQVGDLHITNWLLPHEDQWNTQSGVFVNFPVAGSAGPQFEGGARWLKCRAVYFCKLLGTAALQSSPSAFMFPIRHALCNLPACYEHEVNKTLGHHKSLANDMSGAEIRQPEQSSAAQSREASLSLRSLQLLLSFSPPRSQCVRSLLKLQLN